MKDTKQIIKSIPYCIVGFIYVFLSFAIRTVTTKGNLIWSAPFVFKSLIFSVLIGTVLGFLISYLIKFVNDRFLEKEVEKKNGLLRMFLLSFAVLIIAYIPFFLAYYPGILSYDSYSQIRQLFDHDYYEHHPLFHTMMIGICVNIGNAIFGNVNAGAAIYSILQIFLFAASVSYAIAVLYKRVNAAFAIAAIVLFALFPFNGFMAVTMTKDVLFSAAFLLMYVSITEMMKKDLEKSELILNGILLFVSVFGVSAFRNNGKYALIIVFGTAALYALICLIVKRKEKGAGKPVLRTGIIVLGATLFSFIFLIILSKALSAAQGDRREMLSVPIQQLSRTYVYHAGTGLVEGGDDTMDEESKAYLEELFADEGALLYDPDISDPVKRHTITAVFRYQLPKFVKVYTRLFFKYPGEFINAFLALDAGYLDIGDETHAHINEIEGAKGMGYVQTEWSEDYLNSVGFFKDSKIVGLYNLLDSFADKNAYLYIPVFKYFFMPGIWFWIFVNLLLASFTLKRFENVVPLSLIAGYYLTIFFGPCVQLRYLYPVMIIAPFVLIMFIKGKKINEQ